MNSLKPANVRSQHSLAIMDLLRLLMLSEIALIVEYEVTTEMQKGAGIESIVENVQTCMENHQPILRGLATQIATAVYALEKEIDPDSYQQRMDVTTSHAADKALVAAVQNLITHVDDVHLKPDLHYYDMICLTCMEHEQAIATAIALVNARDNGRSQETELTPDAVALLVLTSEDGFAQVATILSKHAAPALITAALEAAWATGKRDVYQDQESQAGVQLAALGKLRWSS